jgi:hypothetical protein
MLRWLWFFVAILFGAAAGLFYGWVINPVEYVDTTPATLRSDYQTDYVLMVAEVYHADGDIEQAARRLALLGDRPLPDIVRQAMVFAAQAPYADSDQVLLSELGGAMQAWNPQPGAPQP